MTFHELLFRALEHGGFSTEDALASFLPLARQTAQIHASGRVAPLDGVDALAAEGAALYFPDVAALEPRLAGARVRTLDSASGWIDVHSVQRRVVDSDTGIESVVDARIGTREGEITAPAYLPGYASWEHRLEHHDPSTDVFSLGMILASLICGLDFNDPDDLGKFVAHRRNVFVLAPHVHPVVAQAIVQMTELSRRARPQDLPMLIDRLAHYREQNVDIDFELSTTAKTGGKKAVILETLRNRLFEISRRNRLLHFRAAAQDLNLTQASVPLSFQPDAIKPESVLTWSGEFARALSAGEAVTLNRYLNVSEQLYVPGLLDRLRADAARDAAEFGFEQLRVAVCFLRWSNLKADPAERYDSPLVLLPVKLVKRKGVRDAYILQPQSTEAEVNPLLRHLFAQLYGIELPEKLDLSSMNLDELFADLRTRVTASEPGVTLTKIARPRIDLIHEQAKRRLERYRRSARISGRGVRRLHEVDYSYDPANYHPLGLALFNAQIRHEETHLQTILQEKPAARSYLFPPLDEPEIASKEKSFYALRTEADENPYHWEFDLCRVTLGNFRYRKMTLVRDYADLATSDLTSPAFDAVFSLQPRPLDEETPQLVPLVERFAVVASDPTQTAAIGLARDRTSYIIQGPPGTGKSQTITNLIADFVVRGKKVLFVCEKRAAIDVVYARLKQRGLHQLCCLIHDSQGDKKDYYAELKATYEAAVDARDAELDLWNVRRSGVLRALQTEIEPLEAFGRAMATKPAGMPLTVHTLLTRAIDLPDAWATLDEGGRALLPGYSDWLAGSETLARLAPVIAETCPGGVLANHALARLSSSVLDRDRPARWIAGCVEHARNCIADFDRKRVSLGIEPSIDSPAAIAPLLEGAVRAVPLAEAGLAALLDARSALVVRFRELCAEHGLLAAALTDALTATKAWRTKLVPAEAATALERCRAFESSPLRAINPAWWRLRKILERSYDMSEHVIKPTWTHVLTELQAEYAARAAVADAEHGIRVALKTTLPLGQISDALDACEAWRVSADTAQRAAFDALVHATNASDALLRYAALQQPAKELLEACAFIDTAARRRFSELLADCDHIARSLDAVPDFLFCLAQLRMLPPSLAAAFRVLPLTVAQLEGAILRCSLEDIFQSDRALQRFNAGVRDAHARRLASLMTTWTEANAARVLEKAHQQFADHLRLSTRSITGMSPEEREMKGAYSRGRRELEHEFGKVMRHKSIRDLVAGDAGRVIGDLKPVWLMSPLSVCDTLPLRADQFDVVIFDEASQIALEEAIPSIFRAPQAIVVGDEMQLPPTDFFSAHNDLVDETGNVVGDDGKTYEYDLSANSFLNHAAKNLNARMLGWHYRSRSESLIGFSNAAFYEGKLLTVPDARASVAIREEIIVNEERAGTDRAARVLDRPVSFHLLPTGVYENRRNLGEAEYIAGVVRDLLFAPARPSIGIIAFSEAQQSEIEAAISRLAAADSAFRAALDAEYEREIDGQFAGLLVKNLENIQGDERDVILLSVCYGNDARGKMRMNFGPINQSGGEKRLNVAFSRARHHMAVVSSILPPAITNEYNDGANCLKTYLRYAAACSAGDMSAVERILRELADWRTPGDRRALPADAIVERIAEALRLRGYLVTTNVGLSRFRCDIAVRRYGDDVYRLGILVDTGNYYEQADLLERELLRPQLLVASGWRVAHVLIRDWYADAPGVIEHLLSAIDQEGASPASAS